MFSRITGSQLLQSSQRTMAASRAQLARLQDQASSGKAITKPSDDPGATAEAMRVRGEARATKQYGSNIDDGLGWLSTADSALGASTDLVSKAIDLGVQGGNGALDATGREAVAAQLDGIRADLLTQSNASYLGRTVFAGNADTGTAFTADGTGGYGYSGTAGATVQRRIGAADTIGVDADGAAAFGRPGATVFASIDAISTALRAGDGAGVTSGLNALRSHLTDLSAARADVGGRYARLDQAKASNLAAATTLETRRAGIEDVDSAEVFMNLQTQQVGYQTALAVTARTIQPTLLSFLS